MNTDNNYSDAEFFVDLQNLLGDRDFLQLERSLTTVGLFETIAASHRELWHSAFLKWVLDPQSELGLDDFPLKRLVALILHTMIKSGLEPVGQESTMAVTVADVEMARLTSVQFTTERTVTVPSGDSGKKSRRIDLVGESLEVTLQGDSDDDTTKSFRLILENKIEADESNDQTLAYAAYAEDEGDFDFDFFVFLTPDDDQMPKSKRFVRITYDELYEFVLRPCSSHPQISSQSKYLLDQYILNLGKPLKSNKPMANPRKMACNKIFNAHRRVLDEIYGCAGKEPIVVGEDGKKQVLGVTLEDLVKGNRLALTDVLYATYKDEQFRAALKQAEDGVVSVMLDDQEWSSPSQAGKAARGGKSTNGWDFWSVQDQTGKSKGKLTDLREKLLEDKPLASPA